MNLKQMYITLTILFTMCATRNIDPSDVPVLYWDESTFQFKDVRVIEDVQNDCGDKDTYYIEVALD